MADDTAVPDKEPSIHDHPWLQEVTGINPSTLGAVMLPVNFTDGMLERGYEMGILNEQDLFTSTVPERFWIKGDVTEKAHVSLLYGLLTPAYEQPETIYRLLAGWPRPAYLPVTGFEVFPSPYPDEAYGCIVARVGDPDGAIEAARGRLRYLPHVDCYPEAKLHATVAYVVPEAADRWVEYLSTGLAKVVEVPVSDGTSPSLDLGSQK